MNHRNSRLIAIAAVALLVGIGACFDVQAATVFGFHIFQIDPMALAAMALMGEVNLGDPEAVTKELKRISDQVKEAGTKAIDEATRAGKLSDATKDTVDQLLTKQGEMQAVLTDLAQKSVRGAGHEQAEQKSIGQQVAESEGLKDLVKNGGGRFRLNVKAIIGSGAAGSGTGASGSWVRPDRIISPLAMPGLQRMTIRDLMAPGRTNSNLIEYVKESGFTNSTGIAPENTTKPQSDLTFTLVQSPVATLAHWIRATKQILDDAPMLQSYIDTRLRYGLMLVEERQLLNGSGTGGNLNGVATQAVAYAAPIVVAGATMIDTLRLALLQVELALYPPSGIVLHPSDWAAIELLKDTQGRYIFANPQQLATPRMWGLDVVPTMSMTQGRFLVGAFSMASQVFDREDANVLISTEDQDNFIKNLVTIRAEERLASAVYRPEAFVDGPF